MCEPYSSTSLDTQLVALGHSARRRVLLSLLNDDTTSDVSVIVDASDPESSDRDLWLAVYHTHLPKLEQWGFIETGPDRQSVSRGERFDEIAPLLELIDDNRGVVSADWV